MDVSVVIPTYNRADLLPATLDAILAQTLPPREVIVVDDGSTDETATVLARYPVRTIVIANSGSIVARNAGLRAASAPFVAFCDSDDLWRPGFLARMAALWQAEPKTRVAYANFHLIRDGAWEAADKFRQAPAGYWDGLRPLGEGLGVFDRSIVDRIIAFQPFFQSACVADRAAILAAGGWDEGVGRTVGDDFGTVLRFGEMHPFGVVTEPLVGIRKHAGNFSADVRRMNLGDADILDYVLATRPSLRPYADLITASAAKRRREALEAAFADGDWEAVRAIDRLLPATGRTPRTRLKRLIAGLPGPMAHAVARTVSAVR